MARKDDRNADVTAAAGCWTSAAIVSVAMLVVAIIAYVVIQLIRALVP